MDLDIRRFEAPDEIRDLENGTFEVIRIGGVTLGRASYEPGWKWSKHVGPRVGTDSCQVEHVGMVVSGRAVIAMDDDTEVELVPGDLFHVPPGHDAWVVGREPYVSVHFLGATEYASAVEGPGGLEGV